MSFTSLEIKPGNRSDYACLLILQRLKLYAHGKSDYFVCSVSQNTTFAAGITAAVLQGLSLGHMIQEYTKIGHVGIVLILSPKPRKEDCEIECFMPIINLPFLFI